MSEPTLSTADLCDAHEGRLRVMEPGHRCFGAHVRFEGRAETVKCHEDNSLVKQLLATPGEGRVLVVDGGRSMRRALLGDQLASSAVANGWVAVVIDGCIRDSAVVAGMPIAVRALGTHPLKCEKRGEGQVSVAVVVGGVRVEPGDYVYGDEDGIVVSDAPLR